MENASKALIIAGAILISILLISVGILIFNSTRGFTDNASATDDAMELAAALENAKIVLGTMDIENDKTFNDYIYNKYAKEEKYSGNSVTRSKECKITATQVRELCVLVIERNKQLTGGENDKSETYVSSRYENCQVYYRDGKYHFELDNNALYTVTLEQRWDGLNKIEGAYSVQIKIAE